MALHLHRAERADGLGAMPAHPSPDLFAEEFILLPARGVGRWLGE
jgi:hypothetical protein